jgi:hypothetical protein
VANLVADKPDGTTTTVPVSGGPLEPIDGSDDEQQQWTSDQPVTYDLPGRWVLRWTVTGTGEGVEDLEVYVVASPVAGGPTWLPGRSRVAAYVPHRTLVRSPVTVTGGQDGYAWTFDSTTTPPGITVDRLIADGADWVTALLNPIHTSSHPTAAVLAALWAAISVERSWPKDDQALQRANDMEKQLNTVLAGLKASNAAANEGDGVQYPTAPVGPVYSFPPADLRWDHSGYW